MKNIVRKCFALAQIRWASYTGNNKRKGWNADLPDSNITKHAIAAALKELCREKSFDKISIADITSTCGLNRQTFYYHFEDKYELLNWIYYTEGFARLVDGITLENWDSHIAVLFETMRADKSSTKYGALYAGHLWKLFVQSGARTFPGGRRSSGQWHGTGCRQGVFCRLLCLRKLRNSQSLGGCRYENAARGAGPQPKTACTGQ